MKNVPQVTPFDVAAETDAFKDVVRRRSIFTGFWSWTPFTVPFLYSSTHYLIWNHIWIKNSESLKRGLWYSADEFCFTTGEFWTQSSEQQCPGASNPIIRHLFHRLVRCAAHKAGIRWTASFSKNYSSLSCFYEMWINDTNATNNFVFLAHWQSFWFMAHPYLHKQLVYFLTLTNARMLLTL